jgi:hypothetical protein
VAKVPIGVRRGRRLGEPMNHFASLETCSWQTPSPVRRPSLPRAADNSSSKAIHHGGDCLAFIHKYKMLRISPAGQFIPSRLARINRNVSRRSLAVNGDALIHGPNLVAWSVVSERRIHHLHQVIIQNQSVTN